VQFASLQDLPLLPRQARPRGCEASPCLAFGLYAKGAVYALSRRDKVNGADRPSRPRVAPSALALVSVVPLVLSAKTGQDRGDERRRAVRPRLTGARGPNGDRGERSLKVTKRLACSSRGYEASRMCFAR